MKTILIAIILQCTPMEKEVFFKGPFFKAEKAYSVNEIIPLVSCRVKFLFTECAEAAGIKRKE